MTETEIVNWALTSFGNIKADDMTDSAKGPARAITAYPLARDTVLRMVPWPSCTARSLILNMIEAACPWTASTQYYIGQRVTNDTAKTYTCTAAGISAGSGGPTGTTSAITDGTATWTYTEASTAVNNWVHAVSTAYAVDDIVIYDTGKLYVCVTAGTSGAASPPTGVTKGIEDNDVRWDYYGTPPYNRTIYGYQFIIPADCLLVQKIPSLAATTERQQGVQYKREQNWIYCNQADSVLIYTLQEEDPTRWDTLLQETVAMKIASDICFNVTRNEQLAMLSFPRYSAAAASARMAALYEGSEAEPEVQRWEDV